MLNRLRRFKFLSESRPASKSGDITNIIQVFRQAMFFSPRPIGVGVSKRLLRLYFKNRIGKARDFIRRNKAFCKNEK